MRYTVLVDNQSPIRFNTAQSAMTHAKSNVYVSNNHDRMYMAALAEGKTVIIEYGMTEVHIYPDDSATNY